MDATEEAEFMCVMQWSPISFRELLLERPWSLFDFSHMSACCCAVNLSLFWVTSQRMSSRPVSHTRTHTQNHCRRISPSRQRKGQKRTACVPSRRPKFHDFSKVAVPSQVIYSVVVHRALMKIHEEHRGAPCLLRLKPLALQIHNSNQIRLITYHRGGGPPLHCVTTAASVSQDTGSSALMAWKTTNKILLLLFENCGFDGKEVLRVSKGHFETGHSLIESFTATHFFFILKSSTWCVKHL